MRATHPSSVLAHWTPIPWNMYVANSGKIAPKSDRKKVFAAIAEAANYGIIREHVRRCGGLYLP